MKRNVKVLLGLMALVLSLMIGGVAVYAYSGGFNGPAIFDGKVEFFNYDIDKASLEVYNGAEINVEDDFSPYTFVKSAKDYYGNDIDFSEINVKYQRVSHQRQENGQWISKWEDIPASDILNDKGDIDGDKMYDFLNIKIEYSYSYDIPEAWGIGSRAEVAPDESQIIKAVYVEIAGF